MRAAATGTLVTFDMPGAKGVSPHGVNDRGEIVGSFLDQYGAVHGFLRSASGAFTVIDVPGASYPSALGINNAPVMIVTCCNI